VRGRTTYLYHVARLKTAVFLTRNTGTVVLGWREHFYRYSFRSYFCRFVDCFFAFVVLAFLLPNATENKRPTIIINSSLKYSTLKLANVHTTASVMLRLNDLVFF